MKRIKFLKKSLLEGLTTNRREYKILTTIDPDPYWDECITLYPLMKTRGAKPTIKRIMSYQVRMYKTWKHNRKTQWK